MSSGGDLNNDRCSALYGYHGGSRVSAILGSTTIYDNCHTEFSDIYLYHYFFRSLGPLVCDSRIQSQSDPLLYTRINV